MKIITIATFLIILMGCNKVHELSEEAISWQPYCGGDTVVFKSNLGDLDTIFIENEIKVHQGKKGPSWFQTTKWEYLRVYSKSDLCNSRYKILSIKSSANGPSISFSFLFNKGKFYAPNTRMIEDLEEIPLKTLTINDIIYDDIIVLNNGSSEYIDRDNFIIKVYWSCTRGYVRIEKNGGRFWNLLE